MGAAILHPGLASWLHPGDAGDAKVPLHSVLQVIVETQPLPLALHQIFLNDSNLLRLTVWSLGRSNKYKKPVLFFVALGFCLPF